VPLKDRRSEYSWPRTLVSDFRLKADKSEYSQDEEINLNYSFRLIGGLRESFRPDVWTLAWEDYDKLIRLHYNVELKERLAIGSRKILETGKRVRKATFYWSRDPDLPYRIWAMIIPEDGSHPIIPEGVDDAKSRMFDFEGSFILNASMLGKGRHRLFSSLTLKWFRRSFIEKGKISSSSQDIEINIT
jgi:hypothetical protein